MMLWLCILFCNVIGDEKTLYTDCDGHFSTAPSGIQLFLTDIVEHFKDSLPLNAILFLDSDLCNDRIAQLASKVVTLTQVSIETSIIATTCFDENDASLDIDEDAIPVAIPTVLDLAVTVLREQSESESLYGNTRYLYDNFLLSKVQTVSSDCNNDYMTLKQSVREGYEYQGLEIVKPSKVYCENQPSQSPNATGSSSKRPQVCNSHNVSDSQFSLCSLRACVQAISLWLRLTCYRMYNDNSLGLIYVCTFYVNIIVV